MDDVFVSSLDGSESTLREVLDALGSDYDENGIPYWEDDSGLAQRGYNYKDQQIEGRDNV